VANGIGIATLDEARPVYDPLGDSVEGLLIRRQLFHRTTDVAGGL
jgi:hypothetical protein